MNGSHHRKKRKKDQKPEPPPPMPLKDKLKMWAWIVGFIAVPGGMSHCMVTQKHRTHLDKVVAEWKRDYHLTDDQAKRIRTLEQEFHGNGNAFAQRTHTTQDVRAHHEEIAGTMNPLEAERFLKAQEGRTHH